MSRSGSRKSTRRAVAITVLVLYGVLYWWQYIHIYPHAYADPDNTSWLSGLIHGLCAWPNLLDSIFTTDETKSVVQADTGFWYMFWFLYGVITSFSLAKALAARL